MKELNAAWTTIKRKEWETRISQETKRGLKAAITKEYTDNFGLNFPQIMLDEKRQAKKILREQKAADIIALKAQKKEAKKQKKQATNVREVLNKKYGKPQSKKVKVVVLPEHTDIHINGQILRLFKRPDGSMVFTTNLSRKTMKDSYVEEINGPNFTSIFIDNTGASEFDSETQVTKLIF